MKKMIKTIRNFFRIISIDIKDLCYDIKYCGFYKDTNNKIPWRILLLSHSLEKGLSVPKKRKSFGEDKARDLHYYLNLYKEKEDYVFCEGRSVLNSYIEYRKKNELSYQEFELPRDSVRFPKGGTTLVSKDDLKYNYEEFKKLSELRHSVREYNGVYVEIEEIEKAVDIARMAPSACNRQMIKVYTSSDIKDNQELSKLIPGNNGFKDEKARYLFLSADRNAFDYFELNQWYLNGGIFLTYLQLAFTAQQIGSCIYQWPKNKKIEKKAKHILNIPKNEIIVAVLGVGHLKDEFYILNATRKNVNDILVNKKEVEYNDKKI